jgi:uncharacterized Zn finger protein (UPF0148 family)
MADLLRQGSTLTDLACPACASPIFRLKNGDLWCGKCQKRVVVVKEGESVAKITGAMTLESLETTLLAKIQEIQGKMQNMQDAEELQRLGTTLNGLLETLERTRKAKNA